MIPAFNDYGCLPDGIYDCTMDEAAERFGVFQGTDRRPQLWAGFTEFVREVKACGLVEAVIVDGSFVTSKPDPNDIDLLLVVAATMIFHQTCRRRNTTCWPNTGCADGLGLI